ncbi:hypothetical protein ACQW02_25355 [Humitalea sp. 24SJ18S-53]|uniref:hypothetical protein n=1 Tax=Humitalea sp. 24SJ18S-53 TaxID=3422307 RepID=UPI003D67DE60
MIVWRPWSKTEDDALRDATGPIRDVAAALGRTEGAARARRGFLGLNDRICRWTDAEDEALRTSIEPTKVLARRLGRTPGAMARRCATLGIVRIKRVAPPVTIRAEASTTVTRRCLQCRVTFETPRHLFVCARCKSSVTWREADLG